MKTKQKSESANLDQERYALNRKREQLGRERSDLKMREDALRYAHGTCLYENKNVLSRWNLISFAHIRWTSSTSYIAWFSTCYLLGQHSIFTDDAYFGANQVSTSLTKSTLSCWSSVRYERCLTGERIHKCEKDSSRLETTSVVQMGKEEQESTLETFGHDVWFMF